MNICVSAEELRESRRLLLKQERENARKERIFDNKARQIGIDTTELSRQIQHREEQAQQAWALDKEMEEMALRTDRLAAQRMREIEKQRRHKCEDIAKFNVQMKANTHMVNQERQRIESEEKLADIHKNISSGPLAEELSGYSYHNRVLPDRWKGMTDDQLSVYWDAQRQQMADKKNRHSLQHQQKLAYESALIDADHHLVEERLEAEKERRRKMKQMERTNIQLAAAHQQKLTQEHFNMYHKESIGDEFFDYFGTTSR